MTVEQPLISSLFPSGSLSVSSSCLGRTSRDALEPERKEGMTIPIPYYSSLFSTPALVSPFIFWLMEHHPAPEKTEMEPLGTPPRIRKKGWRVSPHQFSSIGPHRWLRKTAARLSSTARFNKGRIIITPVQRMMTK
jgi:hypothetical protein